MLLADLIGQHAGSARWAEFAQGRACEPGGTWGPAALRPPLRVPAPRAGHASPLRRQGSPDRIRKEHHSQRRHLPTPAPLRRSAADAGRYRGGTGGAHAPRVHARISILVTVISFDGRTDDAPAAGADG